MVFRPGALPRGFSLALPAVAVLAVSLLLIPTAYASPLRHERPILIGYKQGDDWEPAVASDKRGDVYVIWAHFGGVPTCPKCGSPSALMEISRDSGRTFGHPFPVFPTQSMQVDVNVKVNYAGVVFVTYLNGPDTVVQRSLDRGQTWSAPIELNAGLKGSTDKPGLVVIRSDVYVAFDINGRDFIAVSHDLGRTFGIRFIDPTLLHLGFSLNSGGTASPTGIVYFAWTGVHNSSGNLHPQSIYLTRSNDAGGTWAVLPLTKDLPSGPACPQKCGWDYLGPQVVVAVDHAERLYVLYNAGTNNGGAPSIWYRTSWNRGESWSPAFNLATDSSNAWHVFPAIGAGPRGEVFVAWMDNHTGAYNVWSRFSLDGGRSWSAEIKISEFRAGFPYVDRGGFRFPYGDYFTIDPNPRDQVNFAWGEGPNWTGPGNVLYSRVFFND